MVQGRSNINGAPPPVNGAGSAGAPIIMADGDNNGNERTIAPTTTTNKPHQLIRSNGSEGVPGRVTIPSVLQRRTSYYQEKLFNNGKTIARRDTSVGQQDLNSGGSCYDYSKSTSSNHQPNYWSSSTGYFGFKQPRPPNGPALKFERSPSPEETSSGGIMVPPLPHGSNSALALKRFTDADLDLNKQRYYGEFIMRRDQLAEASGGGGPSMVGHGNPASSSTGSEDASSQHCLLKRAHSHSQTMGPQQHRPFRNFQVSTINQPPIENITTIKVDESLAPDGSIEVTNSSNHIKSKKKSNTNSNSVYSTNQKPALDENGGDQQNNSANSADAKIFQSFLTSRKFAYPNMTLLRRINERYKKTEHFFMALKIFSLLHLMVGVAMLALDWAQAILLWEDVTMTIQRKINVVLRCLYPVYILLIAATSGAVALQKRALNKTLKLLCIVLLAVLCLVPSDFVLVQSMTEAIQFSVAKRQSSTSGGGREATTIQQGHLILNDDPMVTGSSSSASSGKSRSQAGAVIPRLVLSTTKPMPILFSTSPTKNYLSSNGNSNEDNNAALLQGASSGSGVTTPVNLLQPSDMSAALNELINNPTLYKNVFENYIAPYVKQLEAVNTVHHLRIAYCLFGGVHLILTLLTLFTTIRLEAAP